jgi:hypothetical protein
MTAPVVHGDVIPLWMQPTTASGEPAQICYGAMDYRQMIAAIFPTPGVVGVSDWGISAGGGAILNIAVGNAVVAGNSAASMYSYLCVNRAIKTTQPPGPPNTQNRYDLIVLTAHDGQVLGDHIYEWQVQCISGSEAASPSIPATPKDSINLAAVLRKPGAATIAAADITDLRKLALLPTQPKSRVYWKSESTANSPTFTTAEKKDTTVPDLVVDVLVAGTYRIMATAIIQNTAAGRTYMRVRDGGSSSPAVASTLLAYAQGYTVAGSGGNNTLVLLSDLSLSVGRHILGLFANTSVGTGTLTASTTARKQLSVYQVA